MEGQASHAGPRRGTELAAARAPALRVDHEHATAFEDRQRRRDRLLVPLAAADGKGPDVRQEPLEERAPEQLRLGHPAHSTRQQDPDEPVVHAREVVRGEDHGPIRRDKVEPLGANLEREPAVRIGDDPRERVEPRRLAGSRVRVKAVEVRGRAVVQVHLVLDWHEVLTGHRIPYPTRAHMARVTCRPITG